MSLHETASGVSSINPVESPGRVLAAAREAHSLSPADLAAQLRLDTKIVLALERDDFENLPAPTFVKGYIRSIAKALNLDSRAIIESYEALAAVGPPALSGFASRAPDQIGTNNTIIKVISYGLVATLILLIALWWRSNYQHDEARQNAALEPEPEVEAASEPFSDAYDIVDHEPPGLGLTAQEIAALYAEGDVTKLPMSDDNSSEVDPNEPHRLLISTTDEAWIEVYDLNGNKLYYGLTKKDQPVEIDTEKYYRLTLGNTDSISLQYNGEEVDLGPHTKDGVAQLELGTATDNDEQQ